MLLTDVQIYLTVHKRVTLSQLTLHFGIASSALQGMLDMLVRKGKIRRISEPPPRCPGCGSCSSALLEVYEWLGPARSSGIADMGVTAEQSS